jgi:hypothetical protein
LLRRRVRIMQSADAMVLLSRAHADDLAHVAARLGTVGRWSRRPALLLAGAGYPASEVERELGVPVLVRIADDRGGAGALCGRSAGRGPSRSPLGRTAARIAAALATPVAVPHPPLSLPRGPNGTTLRPIPNPLVNVHKGVAAQPHEQVTGTRPGRSSRPGCVGTAAPVLVGGGTPFFTALDSWVNLNLVETRTFPCGVILTRYETRR